MDFDLKQEMIADAESLALRHAQDLVVLLARSAPTSILDNQIRLVVNAVKELAELRGEK